MNKRLRKKLRMGEYTVYGAPLRITLKSPDDFDKLVIDLAEEVETAGGCLCDGFADGLDAEIFVELGTALEEPQQRLEAVLARVKKLPEVANAEAGELVDSWSGDAGN